MQLKVCFDFEYSKKMPWTSVPNGYFSGAVFVGDKLLSEQDLKVAIGKIQTLDQATEFVKTLNGRFALVLHLCDEVFLSTDRERMIPIFYEINGDEVTVYNRVSFDVIRKHGINETALNELNYGLFVSGTETVAQGIKAVMAGETVVISSACVSRRYYHEYNYKKLEYADDDELFELMDKGFTEVTKRLIQYLNGRCAVVPLSGGHDSRLIVYYLKRLGYDNILTYTYGPKGNIEALTSEKVARHLGLDWHFVEYIPKKLQALFKKDFAELLDYFSNGVSSVCIQDWYAIAHLHSHGILPENAVFVPGHSFDAIAGSFILPKYVKNDFVTKQQLRDDIIWKHYSEGKRILPKRMFDYYEKKIGSELLDKESDLIESNHAFDLYQNYNVRERQAKYICCQPKLYEYYGYDWCLPLWDTELIGFWETIDLKRKYNRKLFFEFANRTYGELMMAAPVENEKNKKGKKVNMNPVVRVARKINQLINFVDFHYCLAYFTRGEVLSIYLRTRVLNIGFFVNQKIKKILKDI